MKSSILLLFIFPLFCFSQQKVLIGKVETGTMLSGILVVNLTKETQTTTNGFGEFSIVADQGDLLVFNAAFIIRKRFLVEDEHFKIKVHIPLESQEVEIEAVEIVRSNITSEGLGIVPKNQKRYTTAERRLKTATDMEFSFGLLTIFSLDPILNAISGRTKMLKQDLEIERFNKNVELTKTHFSDEYIISELGIPEKYTLGFRMFLVDNQEFLTIMKTEKKPQITSKALALSEEYIKDIPDEK